VSRHLFSAFGLGLIVTLGLFWVMQIMIRSHGGLPEKGGLNMIEFVRLNRDTDLRRRSRALPQKPPPKKKPSPPKMSRAQTAPRQKMRIDMPNLDVLVNARIAGSLVDGLQIGGFSGALSTGLVPAFRVPPQYPLRAANRGIEGWVRVEFMINQQGRVVDPVVVDSYPSSIFNRAAIRAISRWKFKPKVVAGMVVEQRAVQVMEFKLRK